MADANKKFLDYAGLVKLVGGLNGRYVIKNDANAAKEIPFTSDHMSGVTNVKEAIELLIKNVIIGTTALNEQTANMNVLSGRMDAAEGKITNIEDAIGDKSKGIYKEINDIKEVLGSGSGDSDSSIFDRVENLEVETADIRTDFAAADAQVLVDAKKYADDKVADEVTRVNKKIADDIAAESALRQAEEARLDEAITSALDDAKKYADDQDDALHNTISAEIDADVLVEKGRAEGQEAAIRGEFAAADTALENKINKKIADDIKVEADRAKAAEQANANAAKAAQDDVDAIEERLDKEGGLVDRLEVVEAFKAAQPAIDAEQDRRLGVLEGKFTGDNSVDAKIAAAQSAAEAKAAELDTADKNAQALVDAEQDRRLGVIETAIGEDGLAKRVAANEAAIGVINGEGEGSIKKAIADLVDSAPEAMNTLNELADAINDNKDIYDAYIEQHAKDCQDAADGAAAAAKAHAEAEDAKLKTALQAEIDSDVLVETNRAKGEEARIEGLVTSEAAKAREEEGKLLQKIADEKAALQGEIDSDIADARVLISAEIDADVKAEADRAKEEEGKIREAYAAADTALQQTLQANIDKKLDKSDFAEFKTENTAAIADAVEEESDRAVLAEEGLSNRIKVFEEGDKSVAKQVEAVQKDLNTFKGTQAEKDNAQDAATKKVADDLADEKNAEKDGSLAKKIADEVVDRGVADEALAARIAVFEAGGAQDVAAKEVRLAAAEAKLVGLEKDTVQLSINQAEADAKDYVDAEIAKIVALTDDEITAAIAAAFGDAQ